jgi:hypothetical protein
MAITLQQILDCKALQLCCKVVYCYLRKPGHDLTLLKIWGKYTLENIVLGLY